MAVMGTLEPEPTLWFRFRFSNFGNRSNRFLFRFLKLRNLFDRFRFRFPILGADTQNRSPYYAAHEQQISWWLLVLLLMISIS